MTRCTRRLVEHAYERLLVAVRLGLRLLFRLRLWKLCQAPLALDPFYRTFLRAHGTGFCLDWSGLFGNLQERVAVQLNQEEHAKGNQDEVDDSLDKVSVVPSCGSIGVCLVDSSIGTGATSHTAHCRSRVTVYDQE